MADDSKRRPPLQLPALAARAQLGDYRALDDLLRALQAPLYAHVRQIVREEDFAADVLQETMLAICRRLSTLREVIWVRPWAYRIATRRAVRALRQMDSHARSPLEAAVDVAEPEEAGAWEPELIAELPSRVESLPPASQLVLRLHYLEGLTQPEIAEALEIPLGTVKSRISYGLALLRRDWRAPVASGGRRPPTG